MLYKLLSLLLTRAVQFPGGPTLGHTRACARARVRACWRLLRTEPPRERERKGPLFFSRSLSACVRAYALSLSLSLSLSDIVVVAVVVAVVVVVTVVVVPQAEEEKQWGKDYKLAERRVLFFSLGL